MPIVEMTVLGIRCDRCQKEKVQLGLKRPELEAALRKQGWQPLAAGLWLCPACVQMVTDPADFAAAVIQGRRWYTQGGN